MTKDFYLKDEFWGWILIILGVVSVVFKPFNMLNDKIKGEPEKVITVLLILVILVYVVIAWKGSPVFKAAALFWAVTP